MIRGKEEQDIVQASPDLNPALKQVWKASVHAGSKHSLTQTLSLGPDQFYSSTSDPTLACNNCIKYTLTIYITQTKYNFYQMWNQTQGDRSQ